jgi:RES domain-containing protein
MTQADISSFPEHIFHPDRVLSKIHKAIYDPRFFCDSGEGRFDLKPDTSNGTCYLALSPLGAFVETLGRFRILTQEAIDERAVSALSLTRSLRLADVTDRTVLGKFGITGDISTGGDYGPSQEWAGRLYEAGFDEIFYVARHDPSFAERSVAVFGNEEIGSKLFEVTTEAISQSLVDEACKEFGFQVWPSAPLP